MAASQVPRYETGICSHSVAVAGATDRAMRRSSSSDNVMLLKLSVTEVLGFQPITPTAAALGFVPDRECVSHPRMPLMSTASPGMNAVGGSPRNVMMFNVNAAGRFRSAKTRIVGVFELVNVLGSPPIVLFATIPFAIWSSAAAENSPARSVAVD